MHLHMIPPLYLPPYKRDFVRLLSSSARYAYVPRGFRPSARGVYGINALPAPFTCIAARLPLLYTPALFCCALARLHTSFTFCLFYFTFTFACPFCCGVRFISDARVTDTIIPPGDRTGHGSVCLLIATPASIIARLCAHILSVYTVCPCLLPLQYMCILHCSHPASATMPLFSYYLFPAVATAAFSLLPSSCCV